MAISKRPSILGDLSGKIGAVVVYTYRTIAVLRSRPRKVKKISESQQKQHSLFEAVSSFFSLIYGEESIFNIGYQLRPKEHLSPYNAAISYHLKYAVVGEYPNFQIDISKLRFSRSIWSTENGYRLKFTGEGRKAEVSWELNPYREKATQLDDKAVIVFYYSTDEDEMIKVISADIRRSDLRYSKLFPAFLVGEDLHCWIFFTSANGKLVSETEYLGMIKVMT